jgi:hypothetical protein
MNYIISEKQTKLFHKNQDPNKPLSRFEINLLKAIHEEKKDYKTKKELLNRIDDLLMVMNVPTMMSPYYFELYKSNFREKGDFENITRADFVDPRYSKGRRTLNTEAWKYAHALLPFVGSNMSGFWARDIKGNQIYVIKSYNWYPIYVYKDGFWYEVTKRYSSSTGRQMSNVDPVSNDDLDAKVFLLTPDEMKLLLRGGNHDEIMNKKRELLMNMKSELEKKKMGRLTTWGGGEWYDGGISIKFKIKNLERLDDKIVMEVDIVDVISKRHPEKNYLRGEMPSVDKTFIEKRVAQQIRNNLKEYVGKKIGWREQDQDTEGVIIDFKFNHLKQS